MRIITDIRPGVLWITAGALLFLGGTGAAWAWYQRGPSPQEIAAGATLFSHQYSVDDPLCGSGDGLGPVFNERSCAACHFLGGVGGAGPNEKNVTAFEVFPVPGRAEVVQGVVHHFAALPQWRESSDRLRELFPPVPGAIRTINGCRVQARDFDPIQMEEINTPALFGVGEIERISEAALSLHATKRSFAKVSREFSGDFSGTGVGRLHLTDSGRVGRFGWKGQFASVQDFVASACAMELGLTNPLVSQPKPYGQGPDESAALDITGQQLANLVSFVRQLPRPQQVIPNDEPARAQVLRGEELFCGIGCAACHVPSLGGVEGVYSDFHLYEVESDTASDTYLEPDFDPQFTLPSAHPRPSEWQTPPLWGVADSAPYFHDGKSATLLAAIRRHGRDARSARGHFLGLAAPDQAAVVAFLKSLRAPPTAAKKEIP